MYENDLPNSMQTEAISTANYVLNRCLIKLILKKTLYELFQGKKPNVSYFKAFRIKCFIHNNGKKTLDKFDAMSDKGIFVNYFSLSKAYRVYNKHTKVIEESVHVIFNETNNDLASIPLMSS